MINWDMSKILIQHKGFKLALPFLGKKINSINCLFERCKNLRIIKMNSNFSNINNLIEDDTKEIFNGLPQSGTFYWKKGGNMDKLLQLLPANWKKIME